MPKGPVFGTLWVIAMDSRPSDIVMDESFLAMMEIILHPVSEDKL